MEGEYNIMNKHINFFLHYYDKEIIKEMVLKYNFTYMEALRKFLNSETYKMLSNINLGMWQFGYPAILEMWECEQIVGDPRKSSYIRMD